MAQADKKPTTKKTPILESDQKRTKKTGETSVPTPDSNYAVPDPVIRPLQQVGALDWQTISGLFIANGLIILALIFGGSASAFFNIPALLIVVLGTLAVTLACFSMHDIQYAWPIIKKCFYSMGNAPPALARSLVDMSIIVRKRGTLSLASYESIWRKNQLLYPYVAMVVDGYNPREIEAMAAQELETALDQYRKAAAVMRRAAEFAPGMGLIGTLVGLVQMLGQLQSPDSLGPSMAIALLTTFYGALLGTVVFSPLANKIERNANREAIARQMILTAACSMAVIDNPRRIEMALNGFLPTEQRLSFLTKDFK